MHPNVSLKVKEGRYGRGRGYNNIYINKEDCVRVVKSLNAGFPASIGINRKLLKIKYNAQNFSNLCRSKIQVCFMTYQNRKNLTSPESKRSSAFGQLKEGRYVVRYKMYNIPREAHKPYNSLLTRYCC